MPTITALSASDGQVEWQRPVPRGYPQALTVADGTAYVGTSEGDSLHYEHHFTALDTADGSTRWTTTSDDH